MQSVDPKLQKKMARLVQGFIPPYTRPDKFIPRRYNLLVPKSPSLFLYQLCVLNGPPISFPHISPTSKILSAVQTIKPLSI
jgi:hypothetical protein